MSRSCAWLVPVEAARADEARAALAALDPDASPFAAVPGVHLARAVLLERLPMLEPFGGDLRLPWLFVALDADGPEASVVAAVARALEPLWATCTGFPGIADERFERWLARHATPDGFSLRPYADASVEEVHAALALRRRLAAFAGRADGMAPEALRAAFLEAFPEATR